MFGTNLLDRRSKPERIADQAWEHLVAAVTSAGDTTRSNTRDMARSASRTSQHLAGKAGDRVGLVTDEAWQRATMAFDALAGRRPGLPWGWLAGAGLVGAVVGWAVATAARTVIARDNEDLYSTDRVEFVDVDRPHSPVSSQF